MTNTTFAPSASTTFFTKWLHTIISRDKTNTLLLVFACLSIVILHSSELAWWISISSSSLMIWRSWLTLTGRRLPSKWILIPLAFLLMAFIFYQFRTFLGREAGVAMLTILLSLKMLEMHAKRDLFVVIFLGLFLLTTSFFNSQSLSHAFFTLLILCLLLCAQLSFQYANRTASVRMRFQLIIKMMALAIPLTIFAFLFFPRIQGPFWSLPKDANSARSGLSESMSPGNISKLAMSEELVFRAKIAGKQPERSALYWRAIVLNKYDGRTWSQQTQSYNMANAIASQEETNEKAGTPNSQLLKTKQNTLQQIILEPSESHFIFGLDTVLHAPKIDGLTTMLNAVGEVRSMQTINKRIRYEIESSLTTSPMNIEEQIRKSLQFPAQFNPKTQKLAKTFQQNYRTEKEQIAAVLQYFKNENFYYTLEPPLLGRHSIDEFLFSSKQGFCEHYSSSFVFLMRAMGIPARVVTGYQGGTYNPIDQYYEIRQSDAHAWAEVWLAPHGWVRIDATAAVSPDRILQGLSFTQDQQGFTGMMKSAIADSSLVNGLKMRWSAINNSWNQWVLNYNQTKQFNLLESLGLSTLDWSKTFSILFLIGALLVAVMAIPLLRHRVKKSPIDQVYSALINRISKKYTEKLPSEGPNSYLLRLQTQVPESEILPISRFILLYIAHQYGKSTLTETEAVAQLKSLLKQIR